MSRVSEDELRERTQRNIERFNIPVGTDKPMTDGDHVRELEEANQLLRSAHAIAIREQDRCDRTDWPAFLARLDAALARQHKLMYPARRSDEEHPDAR